MNNCPVNVLENSQHPEALRGPLDDKRDCCVYYILVETLNKINKENRKVMVLGPRLLLILNVLNKLPFLVLNALFKIHLHISQMTHVFLSYYISVSFIRTWSVV